MHANAPTVLAKDAFAWKEFGSTLPVNNSLFDDNQNLIPGINTLTFHADGSCSIDNGMYFKSAELKETDPNNSIIWLIRE